MILKKSDIKSCNIQTTGSSYESHEIVQRMTAAMHEADKAYVGAGGGTRSYVRDCLLPILEKHKLKIKMLEEETDD